MKAKGFVLNALLFGLSLTTFHVSADTAEDCISDYKAMSDQFQAESVDALYECIRLATALNLFGTATAPLDCEGEEEWHLEAKSVVGNPGQCRLRILGAEGCEADLIERSLPPAEAAAWQKFLLEECKALGTIRGSGSVSDEGP